VLSSLKHPNIIRLVEVHFINNVFFLIMVRSSSMCVFMHLHCCLLEVHFINNVFFLIMVRSSSVCVCVFMHPLYCLVGVHFIDILFLIMVHSSCSWCASARLCVGEKCAFVVCVCMCARVCAYFARMTEQQFINNNVFFLIMVRECGPVCWNKNELFASVCVFMHLHCCLVEVHFINNVFFPIMVHSSSMCVFMHLHYCLVEVHFIKNVFFLIMVRSSSVCVCVHASNLLPGGGSLHRYPLPHYGSFFLLMVRERAPVCWGKVCFCCVCVCVRVCALTLLV